MKAKGRLVFPLFLREGEVTPKIGQLFQRFCWN